MMERIFLTLLFLPGLKSSPSLPRQYHFVADPMTWTEAQTYCRNTYTDLVTVENPDHRYNFRSTVSSLNSGYVWIGLYSKIEWKWSDGYEGSGADYRAWQPPAEPDFSHGNQLCGLADDRGTWLDVSCLLTYPFICYNGTPENPEYFWFEQKLSWTGAQSYCRANFTDLATVKNYAERQRVHDLVPRGSLAWIGLHRDPGHTWSDGTVSIYNNWEGSSNPLGNSTVICTAAKMQSDGKWKLKPCDTKYPFVCHSLPTKKRVMKLKFRTEDSVDMNDPAAKAEILKQLQDKLKQDGLSGVTLRWREQPDGKVFYREETCPRKKNDANFPQCE